MLSTSKYLKGFGTLVLLCMVKSFTLVEQEA